MCHQHLPGTTLGVYILMLSHNTARAVSYHSSSKLNLAMSFSPTDLTRGRGACGPIHTHLLFHYAPRTRPVSFFLHPGALHLKAAFPKREATPVHSRPPQATPTHTACQALLSLPHLQNIWRSYLRKHVAILSPQKMWRKISPRSQAICSSPQDLAPTARQQ